MMIQVTEHTHQQCDSLHDGPPFWPRSSAHAGPAFASAQACSASASSSLQYTMQHASPLAQSAAPGCAAACVAAGLERASASLPSSNSSGQGSSQVHAGPWDGGAKVPGSMQVSCGLAAWLPAAPSAAPPLDGGSPAAAQSSHCLGLPAAWSGAGEQGGAPGDACMSQMMGHWKRAASCRCSAWCSPGAWQPCCTRRNFALQDASSRARAKHQSECKLTWLTCWVAWRSSTAGGKPGPGAAASAPCSVPVQAPALARMLPACSSPRVCRSCTSRRGRGAGRAPARASARQLSRRATRSTGSSRPRRRPEAQTAATSGPGSRAAAASGAHWAGEGSSRLLRSGTGRKTRRGGALQGCGQVATLSAAPGAWRSTAEHGVAGRHLNSTLGRRAASVAGLKSSSSSWAGPRGSEAAGACTPAHHLHVTMNGGCHPAARRTKRVRPCWRARRPAAHAAAHSCPRRCRCC